MSTNALLRELAPSVLAAIVRRRGDFAAAEDAVQEALIAAVGQWATEGVPANPRAWLVAVANRRMTDHVRSEVARRRRQDEAGALAEDVVALPDEVDVSGGDDTLVLLFMCCHPALTNASAIALTLRAVGGLTTAEIAKAFLVPEATMAQRISRAKQTIAKSGVAFAHPSASERAARLGAVLQVLYLVFNEGYAAKLGAALVRDDLAGEAIRLARVVRAVLPDDGEVAGLLALMLLTDARRAARVTRQGELVALDDQDRALWDRAMIAEGTALIEATLAVHPPGPYQLQAAIAALHDEAARAADTDWPQIRALYGVLEALVDNPMVALGAAIATAMVDGPDAGLRALEAVARDPRMADSHRIEATRGHLYEMRGGEGDREAAVENYRAAAARTTSIPERDYLALKAARLAD